MSYKLKLIVLHLHIADREGMNGEGIQIGEGDVVLKDLIEHLDKNSICAQFVPEIWQGHTKVLAEVFGKLWFFYKK